MPVGAITIPTEVRDALGTVEGDEVVFRVEEHRAVLACTADLPDLAGVVEVPATKRHARWDEVHAHTRRSRAESRR